MGAIDHRPDIRLAVAGFAVPAMFGLWWIGAAGLTVVLPIAARSRFTTRIDVHGRTGVVARSGPALSVARADGSDVVITLDDARTAAATLTTLVDRHHASSAP